MDLRQLQAFVTAAQRKGFTRAAEVLGVTQAAVSQQVAALERELGTELFDRGRRGVGLTSAGQKLYGYARQILDLAEEAKCQVGGAPEEVSGDLRLAASTVPSEWLLPELLADFRARWPRVRESLVVSDSRVAAAAVEAGEADLGFIGELPRSSRLEARAIADDELVLFVAADHALAGKGTTTVKQIRRAPLIVREPGSASRACLERALDEHGLSVTDFTVAMEANSNESIRAAVARGVGVAFLSKRANPQPTGIVPVKVRGFRPRRKLYLIRDADRTLSSPAREFFDFVHQWGSHHQATKK